jgi:hypothetical protein
MTTKFDVVTETTLDITGSFRKANVFPGLRNVKLYPEFGVVSRNSSNKATPVCALTEVVEDTVRNLGVTLVEFNLKLALTSSFA